MRGGKCGDIEKVMFQRRNGEMDPHCATDWAVGNSVVIVKVVGKSGDNAEEAYFQNPAWGGR
jgi:hypothetical protein